MMALIDGLKASILERNEETTSRQVVIPENNALCTPSIVASLLSKDQGLCSMLWQQRRAKLRPLRHPKESSCCWLNKALKIEDESRISLPRILMTDYEFLVNVKFTLSKPLVEGGTINGSLASRHLALLDKHNISEITPFPWRSLPYILRKPSFLDQDFVLIACRLNQYSINSLRRFKVLI